jgi:molecular chaperone GrpE (heat shock protein)
MSDALYQHSYCESDIRHLEGQKKMMETNYIKSIDLLEKEMNEIDRRIGVAKSSVKKELLTKQYSYLEDMTQKMDEDYEKKKQEIDESIKMIKERMGALKEQMKNEKNSLDHNINELKKYMNNPGSYSMTQVLDKVVNSLEILKEQKKTKKTKKT